MLSVDRGVPKLSKQRLGFIVRSLIIRKIFKDVPSK